MSLELVFKVFPKASERWRGSSEELEARRQAGLSLERATQEVKVWYKIGRFVPQPRRRRF